VISLISYRHQT